MAEGDPLGKLALLIIVLVVFYATLFGLVKLSAETFIGAFKGFANMIDNFIVSFGGGSPLFPNTENLLSSIFSWEAFLFTNAMALALIFFIDAIKIAYRGG